VLLTRGTVLGPLMCLLYINNIANEVSSSTCLFADDCLLYRVIESETGISSATCSTLGVDGTLIPKAGLNPQLPVCKN